MERPDKNPSNEAEIAVRSKNVLNCFIQRETE